MNNLNKLQHGWWVDEVVEMDWMVEWVVGRVKAGVKTISRILHCTTWLI